MHTVYFICVIASIITAIFMHLFEEEEIFFAYIMSVIVWLKGQESKCFLKFFKIIIFTYLQSLFNMICFFFNSFNGGLWRETGGIMVWTKHRGSSIEVRPIRTQSFYSVWTLLCKVVPDSFSFCFITGS